MTYKTWSEEPLTHASYKCTWILVKGHVGVIRGHFVKIL